jgi:hypothetical protein
MYMNSPTSVVVTKNITLLSYSNTSNREIFFQLLRRKIRKTFSLSYVAWVERRRRSLAHASFALCFLVLVAVHTYEIFFSLVFFWLSISDSFNSYHHHIHPSICMYISFKHITVSERERETPNPNSKIFAPQKTW